MSKALPNTSRAMRAMEHALSEARDAGLDDAGPEHLLIGILLDGKSVAARILLAAGVTLERAREVLATARPESLQAGVSASHARPPADPLLDASPVWFLEVDPSSDTPIYEQIIAGIEEAVATSRLEVGERLPTVRQLAEELGVAPGTVARGYSQLEKSGVLETEGARGTRVAARPPAAEPIAGRASTLEQSLRAVVVQGYHLGASADELRAALESAMAGIYDD